MEKLNHTTDLNKYLQFGNLTQPFLEDDFVLSKVLADYNAKLELNQNANKLESLYLWIDHNLKYSKDSEFRKKHKFQRTAKEIWESGLTTGCTDYCLVFSTLARQIGIPSTFLHTAEKNWVNKLKNKQDFNVHYGHSFCECFYEDRWILVDPTCKEIQEEYDPNLIKLNYSVGGNFEFLPYFRDLDLKEKQTMSQQHKIMDESCYNL